MKLIGTIQNAHHFKMLVMEVSKWQRIKAFNGF